MLDQSNDPIQTRLYDADEQKRILELAMRLQEQSGGKASLGDLENVAAEMGVSPEYVRRAAGQLSAPTNAQVGRLSSGQRVAASVTAVCAVLVFAINQYYVMSHYFEVSLFSRTSLLVIILSAIFYRSTRFKIAGYAAILSSTVGSLYVYYLTAGFAHAYTFNRQLPPSNTSKLVILELVLYTFGILIASLVHKIATESEAKPSAGLDLQ